MAKYESAIPYIQKAEGGLSKATTDSASSNPSPYIYKGVGGWHTNRGITWGTFKELAPAAGYAINEGNFIRMPDDVWLKVYRTGFWNQMKGDKYTSQAIANAVVDFAWASGIGGATKSLIKFLAKKGVKADGPNTIAEGFNKLTVNGDKDIFNELIDHRKAFFLSLGPKSNPGGANTKGWMARMEELRQQGLSLTEQTLQAAVDTVKKKPLLTAIIVTGMVVALILIIKTVKQNGK